MYIHCLLYFQKEIVVNFHGYEDGGDLGEGDVKIFLAHLIAMGLVHKGCLEKYWDHGETVKMPFFGTYMGGTHSNQYFQTCKFLMVLWIGHAITDSMTPSSK